MDSHTRSIKPTWTEWRGWPYLIIGLTVLLRVVHIWNSRSNPTYWAPAVDPAWYDQAAQNILQGNWGPFPFFRAPLYPALLAGVYSIFGHDLTAARLLNVALQGTTVWIIWKAGRSYISAFVGIIAALLFALNGMTIYFAAEMVSTSAEMFTAALAMWATFRIFRDTTRSSLVVCGLAWGLAAITRPNFLFVLPVVAAALIWLPPWRDLSKTFSRRLIPILVFAAATAVPIFPITLTNWIKGGEPVLIATQGGVNFWIGNNPEATGILSVLPGYGNTWTMEDAQDAAEREIGHPVRPGELSSFYFNKGWRFLRAHPWEASRFMIRKTALFFNRFEISNNKHIDHFSAVTPWLPPLIFLDFGLLIPLSLLGIYALRKKPQTLVVVGLVILYAISVILFFITSRFRMPAVPWLCLLSAGGIEFLVIGRRKLQAARTWAPLLLLIPGIALAWINIWNLSEAPIGWARYMEGNAFLKLNQLDSARVAFQDALRDSQAVARTELNLGVIAFRSGDTSGARKWYEASLRSDSGSPDAWNNLGTIYETVGDTNRAIVAYNRAIFLKPWAPDPRHNLAGVHFRLGISALKQGQDSLAIHHLETCLSLEPNATGYYDLAIAYGRLGQTDRALNDLNQALILKPDFVAAYQLKVKMQAERKGSSAAGAVPRDSD